MSLDLSIAHSLAAALIKRLEACRLVGYPDSVGKPTNGYGHTGPEVKIGGEIDQVIADHNLDVDLAQAGERLGNVIFGHSAQLTNHEYATLLSFVFNVGAGPTWQIWKDINAGNLADVPHQLSRFINGKIQGKEQVIQGLVNRRNAEIAYWNTADVEQAAAIARTPSVTNPTSLPSSFTRDIPTPPTPAPAPPLNTQSWAAKIAGGIAAVGALGSQVHDIAAPHAGEAHVFQMIALGATGVVVAASILGLLIHADQAHQRTQ